MTMASATGPKTAANPAGQGAAAPNGVKRDSTSSGTSQEPPELDEKRGQRQERRWGNRAKHWFRLQKRAAKAGDSDAPASNSDATHSKRRAAPAPKAESSASPSRIKTFLHAARELYNLDKAQVDAFMDSYVIYSLDWQDEEAMRTALGPDFQKRVGDCLRAYYGVLNHLCALGDVEKMYIPPIMDRSFSVRDNQLAYEESVARDLGFKAGERVLDLGCGRGRVAAHMATVVPGARVTGLNIDPVQLAQARSFNGDKLGLPNEFVEHDFNELPLPFEDGAFDGVYEIQALSLCRDPSALFAELHRVLRPGARLSILDWVKLPPYDASNPEHAELMRRVKPLIGAVGTPTPEGLEAGLRAAGFTVTRSDNASIDGLQAPLIDRVDIYFRSLRLLILALVGVRLLPQHLKTLINRLCLDGQAFVKMDNMRLITTCYSIIAEKPAAPSSSAADAL